MSLSKSSRLMVALPLIAFSTYGVLAASPAPVPPYTAPACTVTADTVRAGQANVTVNLRYTEEIGDTLSATVADGSRLVVSSVRKGPTPMTAELLVNAEQAVAGEWNLSLNGKSASCTGLITVSQNKKSG